MSFHREPRSMFFSNFFMYRTRFLKSFLIITTKFILFMNVINYTISRTHLPMYRQVCTFKGHSYYTLLHIILTFLSTYLLRVSSKVIGGISAAIMNAARTAYQVIVMIISCTDLAQLPMYQQVVCSIVFFTFLLQSRMYTHGGLTRCYYARLYKYTCPM